jgi:hypothetical protein
MTDPFVEVLGPLRQLRHVVTVEFARHGLQVLDLVVGPGPDTDGPHAVHVLAVPAHDELPEGADAGGRDAFDEVVRSAQEAEREQRLQQTREGLLERLNRNDGFL